MTPDQFIEWLDKEIEDRKGRRDCRWATRLEQSLNKRTNTHYEYEGLRMTQYEWATRLGVKRHVISNHIRRGKTFAQTVEYIKKRDGLVKI